MPSKPAAQHGRPSPVKAPRAFCFPSTHHLIVTTDRHVLAWDAQGLSSIFQSGSGGILAAKEAKDGSGLLAIADSQVVLLHDINRGMERSYRLKSTEGQIRLLEYAEDSKSLFFTTTLQNAVQSYSLNQSRLLDPAHTHPSPPTVLATSKSTHLLLTASENPPTIYLQNLTLRTPPLLLQPRASDSAVVVAAFHPERPNVFLLAFQDGTLAAYDATRILRDGTRAPQRADASRTSRAGEISHFSRLHHVTSPPATDPSISDMYGEDRADAVTNTAARGSRSIGITGAAFLPGYRTRAVSVGGDGKCRLVDFDCGGKILRTWHVRGPATSLSILQLPGSSEDRKERGAGKRRRQLASTTDSSASDGGGTNIIAIGRMNGKVMLFDSLGLLLAEQTVDADSGRVIDVEWIKGSSLKAATGSERVHFAPDTYIDVSSPSGPSKRMSSGKGKQSAADSGSPLVRGPMKDLEFSYAEHGHEGGPTSPSANAMEGQLSLPESNSGTVNHVTLEGPVHRDLPAVTSTNYMDLFSPVKNSPEKPAPQKSPQRRPTRSRPRPRILSSTFVDNTTSPPSSPTNAVPSLNVTKHPELVPAALSPRSTLAAVINPMPAVPASEPDESAFRLSPAKQPRHAVPAIHPTPRSRKARRVSYRRNMPVSFASSSTSSTTAFRSVTTNSMSSGNSRILADLSRIAANGTSSTGRARTGSTALLAPYMEKPRRLTGLRAEICRPEDMKHEMTGAVPADNVHATDFPAAARVASPEADDIWLTSSEDESSVTRPTRRAFKPSTSSNSGPRSMNQLVRSSESAPTCNSEGPPSSYHSFHFASSSELTDTSESTARPYLPGQASAAPSGSTGTSYTVSTNSLDLSRDHSQEQDQNVDQEDARTQSSANGQDPAEQNVKLLPGRALSPHGPVTVDKYFPRKSSLKSSLALSKLYAEKPTRGRSGMEKPREKYKIEAEEAWEDRDRNSELVSNEKGAMRGARGKERADEECECGKECCRKLRKEVEEMRREMDQLKVVIESLAPIR